MKRIDKILPIGLTLRVYLLVLAVYTLFRVILFCTYTYHEPNFGSQVRLSLPCQSFLMGLRFDLVITGYIMFFPFLALSVMHIVGKFSRIALKITQIWISVLFGLTFVVSATDIPYFNQFFARFSVTAFQWMDSPLFLFKMIAQEPRYYVYFFVLLAILVLFFIILNRQFKHFQGIRFEKSTIKTKLILSGSYVLILGLIFVSMRGRIAAKSPIHTGTAYFCNDPFFNQLGLNPTFTLMDSFSTSSSENPKLMQSADALRLTQSFLGIDTLFEQSPLKRYIETQSQIKHKKNVILVIMESMSAARMSRFGNTQNLTPFLDSLARNGYSFDNTWTAGIHTYNGIFSTLCSFVALFDYHPMLDASMLRYNGIANTLKKNGYSTLFFTTHDGQFDNVEGFLYANDFQQVISQKDYPAKEILSTLGVPDDYMFRFSMPLLNDLHQKNQPFLAVFMTASNHGPIILPNYFVPQNKDLPQTEQIVEYSDWAIRQLITLSLEQNWFENTIFVFIADHGAALSPIYEMSLNYNHTPFIIYAPNFLKPQIFTQPTMQMDVFPTIMGVLNLPYTNNTMGVDVLKTKRPYAFFCADDKTGVIDSTYFLIIRKTGETLLYNYAEKSTENVISQFPQKADSMRTYAYSYMQTFFDLTKNKKQFCVEN
ncbi:MAG: sulfatase-like hydrolase/transferase [Bacteroidales bacterium]|jgi:phosphoglycerol transferase MdoB-like AlkP superfamily enzyme|nr:sulfatase-like hydrolase/transferase [Bacteroidales bacterium]